GPAGGKPVASVPDAGRVSYPSAAGRRTYGRSIERAGLYGGRTSAPAAGRGDMNVRRGAHPRLWICYNERMTHDDISRIARELGIGPTQVQRTVQLLDEGNTIPFIARYRKEVTGELNE